MWSALAALLAIAAIVYGVMLMLVSGWGRDSDYWPLRALSSALVLSGGITLAAVL